MKDKLIEWLRLPQAKGISSLDDPGATLIHAQIIRQKKFLYQVYKDFYRRFAIMLGPLSGGEVIVELGSGGGFIKEVLPSVVTSDILQIPKVDVCFSGQSIPFGDQSVSAFLMIDVFHHIKDPSMFLKELERCLKPGGRVMMIEPANTLWARFIWTNFHHENFDRKADWQIEGSGPMSDANGALPWIVFCRDRQRFLDTFGSFSIDSIRAHTPFCYLISGGLSMKQMLPSFSYSFIKILEVILIPFNRWLGMFYTIQLSKQGRSF
ncbi:MAG TPA: class I SAM-dependent methyltransferase [Candidatus Omnitrophota bacterium]|nr:class I SAM-dependent methyltransferase [Candidatus Omnitrophota bacterium]